MAAAGIVRGEGPDDELAALLLACSSLGRVDLEEGGSTALREELPEVRGDSRVLRLEDGAGSTGASSAFCQMPARERRSMIGVSRR